MPYLPTPYLVEEHIENVRRCGLTDMMASWTLGGYPGGNLRLLSESPRELAVREFGEEAADSVCQAWRAFSEAMREFPFHLQVVYLAPPQLWADEPAACGSDRLSGLDVGLSL